MLTFCFVTSLETLVLNEARNGVSDSLLEIIARLENKRNLELEWLLEGSIRSIVVGRSSVVTVVVVNVVVVAAFDID